jgi:hypothetical protein
LIRIREIKPAAYGQTIRATMSLAFKRLVAAAAGAATLFVLVNAAPAQNSEQKGGAQRNQGETETPKKIDEFAEAAKYLEGPAGHPECLWLGQRAVKLLSNDDLDTAFRHMELYDRFGCPASHIQAAFRCVIRQGLKASEITLAKVHVCWLNPLFEPSAPTAAAPATTTNR